MILYLFVSPVTLAWCHDVGETLQMTLAHRKELHSLAMRSTVCFPAVRIIGGYLTYGKMALFLPVICFYFYSVSKALGWTGME